MSELSMTDKGLTLDVRVETGALSVEETAPVIADVIDAVAAIHARGGVDRSLSARRVLLDPPRAHLVEVGLQPFQAALEDFAFMAPEQVRASAMVDGRADIYAIGALAFLALTGKRPFTGKNALTLIALKLDRPAPTLESVVGRPFPALLESFVATALALAPSDRYPNIGVVREAWRLAVV